MPAHIKSSMFGCTLTCDDLILVVRTVCILRSFIVWYLINWPSFLRRVPITNGQLNMGTWQVYESSIMVKFL
jgi:hypothetical protein